MKMLDEKDLQAIQAMINASEARMMATLKETETRLETRIEESEARTMTSLKETESRLEDHIEETRSHIMAYIEVDVLPKFDILAEGHQLLRETLAPKAQVEALAEDVTFTKQVVGGLSREVNELKKAQ